MSQNYVANSAIGGFQKTEIDSESIRGAGNTVVVVLDENIDEELYRYYGAVRELIISGSRVILIIIKGRSKISQILCNLLASYSRYDIYMVEEPIYITPSYANSLLERNPSRQEAQTFFTSDMIAYAQVNEILSGIHNIAKEGDIERLKEYINGFGDTIFSVLAVVENMRNIVNTANTGETEKVVTELRSAMEAIKEERDAKVNELSNVMESEARLKDELEVTRKEAGRIRAQLEGSSSAKGVATPIMNYMTYSTSVKTCKAAHIMYFKELSQIPYINSLILQLCENFKLLKLNYKVLIYDNHNRFGGMYAGLTPVGGSNVDTQINNGTIKNTKAPIVVTDTNQAVIAHTLNLDNPIQDVVLVYDRLGEPTRDIVEGNQVTKFWVTNSLSRESQSKYLANVAKGSIITRPQENTSGEYLDIPEIEDYKGGTDSSKTSKYMKMTCAGATKEKVNLMRTIIERARIERRR
jgi:hypothetical protein